MSTRGKKIRIVGLIGILIVGVAGAALVAWRGIASGSSTAADTPVERRIPVTLTAARRMTFEATRRLSGNVQSVHYALVSARQPGTLQKVCVREGALVESGKTELFSTDAVKLDKAVEISRHELTIAECQVRERKANLEEHQAARDLNAWELRQCRELAAESAATNYELEAHESRLKQSAAQVKHAQALVELAEAQQQQAASRLAMALKDQADALVKAPITGRVSQRFREPGEMASPGTAVLKIEDPSVLEVSAHLPENDYARVHPGRTRARLRAGEIDLGEQGITYKSPTVDVKFRTFEIKCRLDAPPEGVVSGRIVDVTVILERREALGVPAEAVLTRNGRPVVFLAGDNAARMIVVETGRQTGGWIEIRGDALAAGAPVVSMGQEYLEDGTALSVAKEAK